MPGVRRRAGGVTGEPAGEEGFVRGLQVHAGHGLLPVSWSGLLACAGVGEPVGVGAGFVDGAARSVSLSTMAAQSRGKVSVLVQPLLLSLEAIATLAFSSRSVRTWNSSLAPRPIRELNIQTSVWELPHPPVHAPLIPDSIVKAHQGATAFYEEGI
jgi:hypothetical protein